jgi:hypothetical protein
MAMQDQVNATTAPKRVPWNKGKLTGAKPPLRPKHVWSIRTKLQIEGRARDLAMFNLAIDSKLRGCEVTHADRCTLVFDTDAKNLYIEREVAHLEASVDGTIEIRTATMDIADYLKQGGQTAGHRELWRLLRTLFKEDSDSAEYTDETLRAVS